MDTTPGAGGYSPAAVMGQDASNHSSTNGNYGRPLAKTASEDLRQSYGGNQGGNSGQNNGGDYSGFNPMANTRLSPSAFDPNSFSGQFILPRFATGGQNDPFGTGVGVMDTSRRVLHSSFPSFLPPSHVVSPPHSTLAVLEEPSHQCPTITTTRIRIKACSNPRVNDMEEDLLLLLPSSTKTSLLVQHLNLPSINNNSSNTTSNISNSK